MVPPEDFPKLSQALWRGVSRGLNGQKLPKDNFSKNFKNLKKFLIHNVIDRLVVLKRCGGTKLGHS